MASVGEISNVIAAGAAVAGLLGSGIAFVWGRVEVINRKTKKELDKCKEREANARERRSMILTAFEFVLAALHRCDPRAPEIARSRHLIQELKIRDHQEAQEDDLT